MGINGERTRRVSEIVKKSAPDPVRPRLSAELEHQLCEVDRDSAACYAVFEDLSYRFAELAEDLRTEDALPAAIPLEVVQGDESIATKAEDLRRASEKRCEDTTGVHPILELSMVESK